MYAVLSIVRRCSLPSEFEPSMYPGCTGLNMHAHLPLPLPRGHLIIRYNYVRRVIETNVTGMSHCKLGPHCLAPFHIRHKILTGHAYTPEFDRLVTSFSDANNLAESITASGEPGKTANTLMKIGLEHIAKGIGFYLQDGAWARKYSQQIFLGTLETMGPDLDRLAGVLGKPSAVLGGNLRKSSGSHGLSELARRNLYRYYNESDYAALRTLVELGLLKDGQYDLTPANGMPTPTTGVPT